MTSVARRREHDDSGEYSDASQDIELNNSGNDGGQPESDYDSQGSESDNSERDPENKETERRVDDDEDRSNPQYIPKRGTFYEHDDRTAASGEESSNAASEVASEKKEGSEAGTERRRPPRKSEIVNKWSHDKYNENEQMPKSREELVAIYGYDIRNEDAPPHARRNRRYGRGPNKYTRTWEDEEAYKRQSAAQAQPRKPPNPEEFPELDAPGRNRGKPRTPRPRSKSQPATNESIENDSEIRRNALIKTSKNPIVKTATARTTPSKPQPVKEKREKMPQIENLTITANVNNVNNQGQAPRRVSAVAQQRPVPTDQARHTQPQPQPTSQPSNKPTPQHQPAPQQQKQQQQNQQQPPASGGGSKRYSSLRQRPLAESYSPQQQQPQQPRQQQQQQPQQQQPPQQQQQQQHRYHAGPGEFVAGQAGHQGNPPPHAHQHHLMHQQVRVGNTHAASPPHQHQPQPQPPQVRLGLLEQQQMVSHPHHLQQPHNMPQPHNIGQLQASQGYAPPAMMPAQYMQQQSGGGAVYGGAMLVPHAPYQHPAQIYPQPHHNYASQGGVTYYNCAEQPHEPPRAQRRPTAAIPIVRPQPGDRPANSSEKDNIDRIVENMFVRKPWPATHGADSKDKQSENRNSQEPPSKDSTQPNSLTSSSISTDSKPSENKEEKTEETKEVEKLEKASEETVSTQESIATDA